MKDVVRKKEILSSIEDMVFSRGFRQMRVGSLAAELRCSRSTLYKLADSKDELVQGVICDAFEKTRQAALASAVSMPTAAEKVHAYLDATRELLSRVSPQFWEDLHRTSWATRVWSGASQNLTADLTLVIEGGRTTGEFCNDIDCRLAASMMLFGVMATNDPRYMQALGVDVADADQHVRTLALRGLLARG